MSTYIIDTAKHDMTYQTKWQTQHKSNASVLGIYVLIIIRLNKYHIYRNLPSEYSVILGNQLLLHHLLLHVLAI